jgi:hypothetical protein
MVVRLREAMDAAQRDAEAAAERAWSPHWEYDELVHEIRDLNNGNTLATIYHPEIGAFVVANSPAAVLRRIAADRKMLGDLLAEKHDVCEDSWYSCLAAADNGDRDGNQDCTCGRDERVERHVSNLAEGWGWTGEATS